MGKISKKPQERHNSSLSPAVLEFVKKISDATYADIPDLLKTWDQRWPYPRGDLMNWVAPLDRFDDILNSFIRRYGLHIGPQKVQAGVEVLVEGTPGADEKQIRERFGDDGDRVLVECILDFSRLLVEKCANRAVYNSSDRLNDLLNTTSLPLLHRALRLTTFLAQRYGERRGGGLEMPPGKFYEYDPDRLRLLASPVAQSLSPLKQAPKSPTKTKGKPTTRSRRTSSVSSPNDFRSLCKEVGGPPKTDEWQPWAPVRVTWIAEPAAQKALESFNGPSSSSFSAPSTPTPLRRQTSATIKSPMVDTTSKDAISKSSSARSLEFSPSDLSKMSIHQALKQCPNDMPNDSRYELLHKLRIAYGLHESAQSRRDILAIRILGIEVIANVYLDPELPRNLLGKDSSSQKPQELVQQLVSLILEPKKDQPSVDLYLQTLSMEAIGTLARHKLFAQDITAALAASSSNGLLIRLTQHALADIANDGGETDTIDGDDWREAVFSLPRFVTEAAGHHGRSSEAVYSTAFITAYVSGLRSTTAKAMRVHLRMLDFIKTFFHHFKDGLQVLLQIDTFEIISNLTRDLTEDAWQQYSAGKGIPSDFKTRLTDYEIPYIHRQVLRSIIDMINDVCHHRDPNADRAARSLVDSQSLLMAFKLVLDQLQAFGAHTWSEIVKALSGFLHNEPTCFTVINEAGIIKSFFDTVTGNTTNQPPSTTVSSISTQRGPGIPASVEAIIHASQLFQAICLTSAGFDIFKASGALEKFFEIFESPPHVRLMKDLRVIGSTFEELVRHHHSLRSAVMSAVIIMIARVRHVTRAMASDYGAGSKLWLQEPNDELAVSGGLEALRQEVIPAPRGDAKSSNSIALPDGKTLIIEDVPSQGMVCNKPQDEDSHGLTASAYMGPAVGFLANFFHTQTLNTAFMEFGGADMVLDFITIPSVPVAEYSPGMHGHMEELATVVHMMAELKPHIILPALADRARYACEQLKPFSTSMPGRMESYFAPLTQKAGTDSSHGIPTSTEVEQNGTYLTRCLMAIYCLAQVLGEVFNSPVYSNRASHHYAFGLVNLADVFVDLCVSLGDISAACVREAIVIQKSIPDDWVKATKPANFSTGDDEVDQILRVWDGAAQTDGGVDSPELASDRKTAAFKNVQTLRYLTLETPAAIAELLGSVGHGIVGGRKKPDAFSKQKTALVGDSIAQSLLHQLQPSFLSAKDSDTAMLDKETRFQYLVVALTNVRGSMHDDIQGLGTGEFCQSYVVTRFKDIGGVKCLRAIAEEFFNDLKNGKLELRAFAANTGLKICLDIFDIFACAKVIVGAPQSSHMKNVDPSKPFYFVPSQALLEFRMEILPLVRAIWTSDYVDQASRDVVFKIISILKHVLQGDSEEEAVRTQSGHPKITPPPLKQFHIDQNRIRELKSEGFDEDLAEEAVYRTNSNSQNAAPNAAKEYCQVMVRNSQRRRLAVPWTNSDVSATTRDTPSTSRAELPQPVTGTSIETALRNIIAGADGEDSEMDGAVSGTSATDPDQTASSSMMDLNNIINHPNEADDEAQSPHQPYSVDSINAERELIREDLAEQCNNVLNTHQDMVFELCDLISSASKKLPHEEAKNQWESTSRLLVTALLSMQADEDITEAQGKKIAAAAHLIALLIQDKEVFKTALGVFQENFEGMLSFLKLSTTISRNGEASYPWIAPILLLIEQMLSQDSEPAEVRWDQPRDLESPMPPAESIDTSTISLDEKKELFVVLIDCLPRVGKDKAMALSIARVMVVLTRKREIALMLAEKRNIQRFFLMIKQLGMSVSNRLVSSFMLVLRHIIEDDETLKEIMRSEIQAAFTGRNAARSLDLTSYVRELSHMVTRSPEVFVQVSNDMLKLTSWQSQSSNLALKDNNVNDQKQAEATEPIAPTAPSIEDGGDGNADESKAKGSDIKPPVVENPDGVIHFLLSELLTYKDVDDKDIPSAAKADPEDSSSIDSPVAPTIAPNDPSSPSSDDGQGVTDSSKSEKPRFKPEEHPLFIYRCFLLQCLAELLHSYNRTKIEFINFSRKSDPMAVTPSKPRSGILNYMLNGLVASGYVDKEEDSIHCKKRLAVSDWAIRVLVALCSKTGEKGKSAPAQRYSIIQIDDKDDEPELTFVRRFVLEHAIKAFKDASISPESLQHKYSKLLCLSDMFNRLLSKPANSDGAAGAGNSSYKVLGRMMFEKNLISVLTSSLAEIDIAEAGAKRVIKFILRPLQELTSLATQLSLTSPEVINSVLGITSDDDISSAASVSEVEDEREETPDLYRNSALGLLDPNRPQDESESDSDQEDEDEEMYDDEEYPDEMEYDDGMPAPQEDDDAVSDDEDEDLEGPVEGLSGDVPMDIEFVVNDGMDVDTGDDDTGNDSEDDDDDSDDDDEDEDGDDFEIEGEDGEINGDNEGDSLGDDQDHEGEWEDEDEEDDDEDDDDDEDAAAAAEAIGAELSDQGDIHISLGGGLPGGLQDGEGLNNLLRVLNGQGEDGESLRHHTHVILPPAQVVHGGEREPEEEDPDAGDDDDEMDENEGLDNDQFDDFMDGEMEDDYYDDQWFFERPSGRAARGFNRRSDPSRPSLRALSSMPPPSFLMPPTFRPGDALPQFYRPTGHAARRPGRQENDDGINPLLQRPVGDSNQADAERDLQRITPMTAMRRGDGQTLIDLPGTMHAMLHDVQLSRAGNHGQLLDFIQQQVHRTSAGMRPRFDPQTGLLSDDLPPGAPRFNPMAGQLASQRVREDPIRAVNFTPATTVTRWQEERAILFGNQYLDKVQRVQLLLMSLLAPLAQQEEKDRRKKREEELEAQRIQEEKDRAEAERFRKEQEERDAAERLEEERRIAAEAEAAAATAAQEAEQNPAVVPEEAADSMEGVQSSDLVAEPAQAEVPSSTDDAPAQERIFVTIRGQELDITGLAIDREYLDALPEELREEVILQQLTARREEVQQQRASNAGPEPVMDAGTRTEYLDDFMNALPEEMREEIRQQELISQRQRERDAARREAAVAAGRPAQAEDMNADDFFATLDPALRRVILSEQPQEILDRLDPRHAAEGREHGRRIFRYTGLPTGRDGIVPRNDQGNARDNKRQVVQLVDKPGVATLLRLMFLPQQGSLRSNLWHILRNVCGNRQTRFEVINMLLYILKEGSTDVNAVERSLASLSLRAKATSSQKTPQPLKRTLSLPPSAGLSEEITPLVVVQQCLSALKQLSQHGFHVRTLFLREIDVASSSKNKKGKDKDSKMTKYPVNDLITLLDRKLISESSTSLQSLAELLAAVTSPLVVLMRKEKEPAEDDKKDPAKVDQSADGTNQPTSTSAQSEDATMAEAPPNDQSATGSAEPAEETKPEETKPTKKPFEPPVIPERNLQLIVGIFVAPECGNDTFHATLDTMSSISHIPGTSEVFGKQLIGHVKTLSQSLCASLDEFTPLLKEAQSSTDLHGITSTRFSHSGSDQVKLLHVLKALDYLSEPKKDGEKNDAAAKSILTTSYDDLTLGPLWSKLSECLTIMRDKDNVIAFANILLPLIESLMVVCKNTSLKEAPLSQQLREEGPTTPIIEELDELEQLFFNFSTEHRKILNDIIRQSPKLMQGNGSFSLLAKNPKVLDFDNKRAFFTKQIHSRLHQQRHVQPPLQLNVRREQVFQDSYKALYFKSADEMKYGKLNIRFNGEEGVDAGGVSREWFQVLARGIFNPDWALWQPVASDKTTFHPNPLSWINGEHLVYFKFIGRIIGKALHEGRVLDCHFSRAVYKRMLGKQPNLKDLESMDLDYYKSLVWILENDITDILTEDFSVVEEQFGEEKVVDLIEDGRNVPVTEENKRDYVQKLVEYRLTGSVSEQLDHFIRGFHDIIPAELVAIFDEQELELLISGLPEIDVDDWKANTEYHNYNANSPQVTWFWRIVRAMSNEERAKLLQFITGTSKVPLNGFKDLEGMQGTTRFSSKLEHPHSFREYANNSTVHREPNLQRLPTSHTCFNQLDLPAYDNQESLKTNIMKAINLGADYFGFA